MFKDMQAELFIKARENFHAHIIPTILTIKF